MTGTPSVFPVIARLSSHLQAAERRRAEEIARRLRAAQPELQLPPCNDTRVHAGLGGGPCLVIEDHSWIRLFETAGDLAYSYRAMLLARQDDLVAIGVERSPAFESYCRERLGLGAPHVLVPAAGPPTASLSRRCLEDPAFVDAVAACARSAGAVNILPYMGTAGIWQLAGVIADRAGVRVRVAAPPALLTRRVNDKLWFSQRAREVLGPGAAAPDAGVYSASQLIRHLLRLAAHNRRIAVKLVDSASSAGILVLEAQELEARSLRDIRDLVLTRLRRLGWRGSYPLLAVAWEQPVLASPSVHLWIPGHEQGGPVCEGIFDQRLIGPASEFAGAVPSALPSELQRRLGSEALRLAALFQQLGYFGRCSFDAIVVGEAPERALVHWVECNGRWGGVSLPLTLVNRLTGNWMEHPFAVLEEAHLRLPPRAFADVLRLLEDQLYRRDTGRGVVLLSPSRLERGTGFELFGIGDSVEDARARALAAARRLTASYAASRGLTRHDGGISSA